MNRECFVVCYSMNSNNEEENDGWVEDEIQNLHYFHNYS